MPCTSLGSGGASQTVDTVFAAQRQYAHDNFTALQTDISAYLSAIQALGNLNLNTNITWNAPTGVGYGFQHATPVSPFTDTVTVPATPQARIVGTPQVPTLDTVGSAPTKPSLPVLNSPSPWVGEVPSDVPVIPDADDIARPLYTIPKAPTLSNIPSVALPLLSLPEFSGVAPDTNVAVPILLSPEDEVAYTSTMLDSLQSQILTVLQGNRGYLDEIFDAIWAREQRNEFATAQRARESVQELWGSRNWDSPGGVESEQLLRIDQDLMQQQTGRARDLAIEQNKVEVERFMQHLTQGIALESRLIQYEEGRAQRSLQARELFNAAAVQLFSATIERINLDLQAYQIEAQVYGELIKAEVLKLEKTEKELQIASLQNEIDQSRVQLYVAQLEGVQKILDVYVAELQGVEAKVKIGQTQVAAFAEKVKAVGLEIQAKELEFKGFSAQVQGQLGQVQIFGAETQAFASRAQAINSTNNSRTTLYQGEIEGQRLVLNQIEQDTRLFSALLDGEVKRFDGTARVHGQDIQAFVSRNQAEANRVQADADQFRALVERARAEESLKLQQGQINANNVLRIAELEVGGLDSIMNVHAQIGSAAMSALNASAGIQGSDIANWNFNHDCS